MSYLYEYVQWLETLPYHRRWNVGELCQVQPMEGGFRLKVKFERPAGKGRTDVHCRVVMENSVNDALHWAERWFMEHDMQGIANDIRKDRLRLNNGQDTLYVFDLHPNRKPETSSKEPVRQQGLSCCPLCKSEFSYEEIALGECRRCGWPSEEAYEEDAANQRLQKAFEALTLRLCA
jgi:hypothetical protein